MVHSLICISLLQIHHHEFCVAPTLAPSVSQIALHIPHLHLSPTFLESCLCIVTLTILITFVSPRLTHCQSYWMVNFNLLMITDFDRSQVSQQFLFVPIQYGLEKAIQFMQDRQSVKENYHACLFNQCEGRKSLWMINFHAKKY